MKRILSASAVFIVGFLLVSPTYAQATPFNSAVNLPSYDTTFNLPCFSCLIKDLLENLRERRQPEPAPTAVPEIDAAGAMIALSLLGGIVAVARERRRPRKKK